LLLAGSYDTLDGMNREQLLETLEQLHVELSHADSVDKEVAARLRSITDDIERALAHREDASTARLAPASRGLNDLMLKFESEHPQLSIAIGRVADALAAMGI
jgi:hypothetical protein